MKISTVKEFRDKATYMFRSNEPVLITRRGKMAGFFLPFIGDSIPLEFKKDLQLALAETIKNNLQTKGLNEEDILEDFEKHRKNNR